MPIVPYKTLAAHADSNAYALGYFECWDLASLHAVLAAAEETDSPVIVGFNGVYLPDVCRHDLRRLRAYGAAGREAIVRSRVPAAFIFNESPYSDWVDEALSCGFNAVMYTDQGLPVQESVKRIGSLVKKARPLGIAVEAELGEPPNAPQARGGSGNTFYPGGTEKVKADSEKTDPDQAARFARETGVDALGVLVGNRHDDPGARTDTHAGAEGGAAGATLDIDLIARLKENVPVPLVLHAGSGVAPDSLRAAIRVGIRRVNIGRAVKEPAFHSIRERTLRSGERYPGYEALGSGRSADLLGGVEEEIARAVREKLVLFGSAGMAGGIAPDIGARG